MQWKLREIDSIKAEAISNHFGFPKSVAEVLIGRNYDTPEKVKQFITVTLESLGSPFVLHGMTEACDRLALAMREKQNILIHGDFDADGITSSALLTIFLREIGVQVETFIPNRLTEGHGLSRRFLDLAVEKKAQLVITCDCGSSNEKEILVLKTHGIDTIVTDHHHITKPIPSAIVVNPKHDHTEEQPEELSGVGVVFMLLMALRKKLREEGFFEGKSEPNLKKYLDIVALGTIADMAPLIGQNRILVLKGLEELQKTTRPGILAMKEKSGITAAQTMNSFDVGFKLAPRINAAARLGYSMEAFEIMVADHPLTAAHLSSQMEEWNASRKKIQTKMVDQCQKELFRQIDENEILVFASRDFHPGLIGLAAQKICSDTGKPAFVFRVEDEIAKGSARCRSPYQLVEIMDSVKDLLMEYGGHSEAGGCKLLTKDLQEFTRRIQLKAMEQKSSGPESCAWVDAFVHADDLNLELQQQLSKLGPFGIGNPEPLLMTHAMVGSVSEVGQGHMRVTLRSPRGEHFPASLLKMECLEKVI
ncbi:MAG: single-stranded-DNA-specific exonuclease RecJ [Bdellovibrionota bacterium]